MEQAVTYSKFADELRDRSAAWLAKELPGSFVSVVMVTLTENRRHATIWVSFPLPQADKEKLFKKVKSALPGLRSSLHRSFTRRMLPEFEVALAHEEVGSFLDR